MSNHIKNIKTLEPANDCDVLKEVLQKMNDDIEEVLKKDPGFNLNNAQIYVNLIFERINSTITVLESNDVKIGKKPPKVVPIVDSEKVFNSLKEILKPLITKGFRMRFNDTPFGDDNNESQNFSGIILDLIKVCRKACRPHRQYSGGKSRRHSRKNKRTRKSKKKARRSKKARKTRK